MTGVKAWPLLLLPFSLVSMGKAACPFPVLNGKIVLSSESILKNSFPDNSEAFVECAKGFERDEGPTSITCVNGVWSPVKLSCKKMDCRQPELSPHMTYSIPDGTFFGAYIQPICETGYDLEGSSHRQCLVSGWSGRAECIFTVCEYPDPIKHGKRAGPSEPVFNDVITYSCDDNYTLVGNSSITCGEYGEYSSPPPECIAACPFPVLNGKIVLSSESILKNSFPDNSEAFVECAKGFERDEGPTSITCVNGVWSPVKLSCKKMDCRQPELSPHMTYSIPDGTFFGAYIQPICETGYDLEGSSHRQCLVSGWSGSAECIFTVCEYPDPIKHGKRAGPSEPVFNDVITYSCDDNYTLVGNSSITCGEYGEYSSPPPECIEMDCRQPELSPHMTYSIPDGTFFGAYIQPICETGYDLEGSSHRQCLVSGWSGSAECIFTVCEYPDPIKHGKRAGPSEPVFNDVITYSCDDNYTLVGNSSITCGEYGEYSSSPPECIVIITQTKASTTTNKATTTDTATASTRSHGGRYYKKLTTGFLIGLSTAAVLGVFFGYRNLKRKGSYNTGEELRAKEELLLNQSV